MIERKLTKEEFEMEFNKLYEDRPIVIFGGGEVGHRAILRMEYLGLKDRIVCIGDNDPNKSGTTIEGIPIMNKSEIVEQFPNARIAITVGNTTVAEQIRNDLKKIGFGDFISRQAFLHRNEFDGIREKALVFQNGKWILRQIVVCITERCTLKCKNCSQLMPRFANPEDLDTDEIIQSINSLLDSI